MRLSRYDIETIKSFVGNYVPVLAVIALWDIAVVIVGVSIALKLWRII